MQTITISGRIGSDAESKTTQGGDTVTSFSLAVDQGYGERKVSNWFRVSIWGKKGSGAAPYLLKGGSISVVGDLEIGEYNGKPQYNVRAFDFTLPAKGRGESDSNRTTRPNQGQNQRPTGGGSMDYGNDLDDEAPFAHCLPLDNVRKWVI